MALDLDKVGSQSAPFTHRYGWPEQATYALGIGAKRDELSYLYENAEGGMKVFPTYAVVPAFPPVVALMTLAQVDLSKVVHGAQKVQLHRPLPPAATLETVATLQGIYDLKRLAVVVLRTDSTLQGQPLCTTEWSIFVMGDGGFSGARPPKDPEAVTPPRREPDWTVSETTSPEQALLYRISGDDNPLHADAAFAAKVGFPQGPILHGLCTFGFMARAAIRRLAGGDGDKLRAMSAQFRKPVWPGDTITTSGWTLDDGKVAMIATVDGRPDAVVKDAWAIVA